MCRRLPLFDALFMFVCWTCVHYLDTRLHHTFISDNYTDCFYYTLINLFYYITLCVELPFMSHAESWYVTLTLTYTHTHRHTHLNVEYPQSPKILKTEYPHTRIHRGEALSGVNLNNIKHIKWHRCHEISKCVNKNSYFMRRQVRLWLNNVS